MDPALGLLKSRRRSAVLPRGLPLVGEARAANSAGDTVEKKKNYFGAVMKRAHFNFPSV